jgi:hypothetical protein
MKDGQTIGQWLNWDFKTNGILTIKDKNGVLLYYEGSSGHWYKAEIDSEGYRIYSENSEGIIDDNRTPIVIKHNGRKYKLIP